MENQEEIMAKLGMFEQQIRQLQQQSQAVDQAISDLTNLEYGLESLVGSKDKEILASIGKGIFAKAKLVSEELMVDIGEGNFVKKSISDTKKIIEEQLVKLEEVKKELDKNLEKINEEMTSIFLELKKENK